MLVNKIVKVLIINNKIIICKWYELIVNIIQLLQGRDLAVDLGCGTGLSTRPLAAYFAKVLGVDPSQSQLTQAVKHAPTPDNVIYKWVKSPPTNCA